MNNGKICVSICERTADELFAKVEQAEALADVIEVRFDCLDSAEFDLSAINSVRSRLLFESARTRPDEVPILSTLRPASQGGHRELSYAERDDFWSFFYASTWGDFEEDVIEESHYGQWENRICSFHDFSGVPENIDEICDRLNSTSCDVVKIAVRTDETVDAIPLWKLLERSGPEAKPIIPIAMGEAGKWTRILGPAHGAFMTYASLEAGMESAPGQVSAEDMRDVYRVKELDTNTSVYGIIAGNTSYSVSPWMHNAAFKSAGLNSVFVPLQTTDLDAFMKRMVLQESREIGLNFKGFSVTNPHKQAIIPYLDQIDETAAKIGAVNTVKIEDGNLCGYNTDASGFIGPLQNAYGGLAGSRVAVFGAGGAARACIFALQDAKAAVTLFARNDEKGRLLADGFDIEYRRPPAVGESLAAEFDIIVNATPLGTAGGTEHLSIVDASQLAGVRLVYDLVYNPSDTRLILDGKSAGVPAIGGLEMLIAQGMRQFEIWTGGQAPADEMRAAVQKRLGL